MTLEYFLAAYAIGCACGILLMWIYVRAKQGSFETIAQDLIQKAENEAQDKRQKVEIELKRNHIDQQREIEQMWQIERRKIDREEDRLKQKEDKIEDRMNLIEKKITQIEKREETINFRKSQLEDQKKLLHEREVTLQDELEKISGMTRAEAQSLLLERLTEDVKADAAHLTRRIHREAEEQAEQEASKIIATAINRMAVSCVSEATVNTVTLPNDEIKGRIIGREGRNIRALERATGVNFMVDETPGAVVVSGFDPIRNQVAKTALTELVMDGRIHPTSIEETVQKAKVTIKKKIKEFGEDAALRVGLMNLHPEIINLLGTLKFRFSLGQNVLDHSIEVSHIMGMIAAELNLDVRLAKRIGLLHDIGKAVSHEVEGTHAVIGHNIALKFGESAEVANGIGCHHGEMTATTVEGSFCSAADAISASRPGARIEAVEEYIKRLRRLEDIAYEFPGIERAYAMQAGRELCIVVLPDMIDDIGIINLARELTKKIEDELRYPGKIKVTVIREKRAIEYAI